MTPRRSRAVLTAVLALALTLTAACRHQDDQTESTADETAHEAGPEERLVEEDPVLDLGACRVRLPEGWVPEDGGHPDEILAVLVRADENGKALARVIITVMEAPEAADGRAAARMFAEGAADAAADRGEQLRGLEPLTLGGRPAYRLDTGTETHERASFFALSGQTAYMIACHWPRDAPEGTAEECLAVVDGLYLPAGGEPEPEHTAHAAH